MLVGFGESYTVERVGERKREMEKVPLVYKLDPHTIFKKRCDLEATLLDYFWLSDL